MFERCFMPYQPYGQKLPATPWLWAYCPVMKVAREGQQSGNESIASANVVPRLASRRFTFGMCATSAWAWSSVITTRMFGRPSLSALSGRGLRRRGQGERREDARDRQDPHRSSSHGEET